MENVTLVIRIDAGLINVNPETVEEALNKYFAPDGAVSVFYAAQQSVHADAGDSAASSELVQASAESTSQSDTTPTQRG